MVGRFTGLAVCVLLISASPSPAGDLESRIAPLANEHKGKVAVAVKHLRTGEEFYLNADEPLPTASLIKLPVMVETYWQIEEGKVKLADTLTLHDADKVPGSGILTKHFSDGATFPLRDGVRLMIAYSDNTATNLVLDRIGIASTGERMGKLGLKETRIHAKVFRASTSSIDPERTKKYGLGSTTAREMVTLLGLIDAGKVVSPAACKEMVAHLKACEDTGGFRRLLPENAVIAHKSGAVSDAKTEAGILYLPSGPVALCVLTAENEDRRWARDNAGQVLLAKVAKEVHDHFKSQAPKLDRQKLDEIGGAVKAAIERGDCPGAVAVVLHNGEVVYRKVFGLRSKLPAEEAMTPDTVFDLASLTKPLATGTSIMQLIERGKIKLSDPVAKHWPDFAANGKEAVTIEHCLLHTSGLTADNPEADYRDGKEKALERVAALKLEAPPGTRFKYSDVGFIVLGHVVECVSGKSLDEFARESTFAPLKMVDTSYRPAGNLLKRVAPTGKRDGKVIVGEVHDPRAFHLGGVAGHAGLFGTADDLARYCRMLLGGGEVDGVRVLSAATADLFTKAAVVPADPKGKASERKLLRSRGWDVDTAYSAQRGETFAAGSGFGHTGFTGTSIWVDPSSKTAIIILTSRLHPDDKGNVMRLRREVGTIVGATVGGMR